jgi:hypothetical protein
VRAAPTLRALGGCLLAGLVVGIVIAGLGSRLVMRLLALADPDAAGTTTENGNVVGEITAGGTLALVVFVGIPSGVLAGLIVYVVRRWLPSRQPWRAFAFSAVLLALLGGTVIDPHNIDFRLLEPTGLAVGLFGLLFLAAGVWLPSLANRWGPGIPRFLYRQDVTIVGGVLLAAVVIAGLVRVGRDIAELV